MWARRPGEVFGFVTGIPNPDFDILDSFSTASLGSPEVLAKFFQR